MATKAPRSSKKRSYAPKSGTVILCDQEGNELGTYDKLGAHQDGLLHRAFSILIYNSRGDMLLQRRAAGKYHSGGLWANACCSHDAPGEVRELTIHRRLQEEMGFDCELRPLFTFVYDLPVGKGMREYERDAVFVGTYDGPVDPNPEEASAVRWVPQRQLKNEIFFHPEWFAPWFLEIMRRLG